MSMKIDDAEVEVIELEEERSPINDPICKPVRIQKSQIEPRNPSSNSSSI